MPLLLGGVDLVVLSPFHNLKRVIIKTVLVKAKDVPRVGVSNVVFLPRMDMATVSADVDIACIN